MNDAEGLIWRYLEGEIVQPGEVFAAIQDLFKTYVDFRSDIEGCLLMLWAIGAVFLHHVSGLSGAQQTQEQRKKHSDAGLTTAGVQHGYHVRPVGSEYVSVNPPDKLHRRD